ncbi:hypothetical protein ACIBFB_20335 [Nocardiopsis sp. NPDC050513]|uniref:hypothetical protein n=1 Tax=Nocardiopsis sp. NPDC050513 TaxID=3364338 RepID=UPI00379AA1F7
MLSSSFTYLDVGVYDPCVANGPILPSAVPIPRVDPDELEAAAGRLRTVGEAIAQSGVDITSTWAGLEGIYTAPESGELLSVIDPVGSDTSATQEAVAGAADALTTFAEEARPLKEELIRLQGRAAELWEEVDGDEEWFDDEDLRERNNYLNNRIAEAVFEFQTAERTCANAIGESYGGTFFRGVSDLSAADPGQTSDGRDGAYYGTLTQQVDVENDWGAPAQASTHWYQDVWAGVADAAVGVVTGTATALGLRDADGEAVYPLSPENFANIGAELENSLVGLGNLSGFFVDGQFRAPDSADDWYATARGPWIDAFEAVVPISEWEDRPGYVISTGAVNVGSAAFGLGAIKVGNDLLGGASHHGSGDVDVDAGSNNPASTDNGPTAGPFEISHGPDGPSTPAGGDLSPSLESGDAQELGRTDTVLTELNDTAEGFSTPGSPTSSGDASVPDATAGPEDHTSLTDPDPTAQDLSDGTPGNADGDTGNSWTAGPVQDTDSPTGSPGETDDSSTTSGTDVTDDSSNGGSETGRRDPDNDSLDREDQSGPRPEREGQGESPDDVREHREAPAEGVSDSDGDQLPRDRTSTGADSSHSDDGGLRQDDGNDPDEQASSLPPDPELEKKLDKADQLEQRLRQAGLTDEDIAQLRGDHPRDGDQWQRAASAINQGFSKKLDDQLHPAATRFALEDAADPREFAYRYEYYKATFDELARSLREEGLGRQQAAQEAAERMPVMDVATRLDEDHAVVNDMRGGEPARVDTDLSSVDLEEAVRAQAGNIEMGHETATAYHARKHYNEILDDERSGNIVNDYLDSAELTIRDGEVIELSRLDNGAERLTIMRPVLDDNGSHISNKRGELAYMRAIVIIRQDGSLVMPTYGRTYVGE